MNKVTFVLGMSGAGKSHYIHTTWGDNPDATILDFGNLRDESPEYLNKYERPTYVKIMASHELTLYLQKEKECPLIVIEVTGMTGVSQAAIHALAQIAQTYEYEVEYIYIRPISLLGFDEHVKRCSPPAQQMLNDWNGGHPRFRSPLQCPYFPVEKITIVDVDHSTLLEEE